jgi:hypothetical protein
MLRFLSCAPVFLAFPPPILLFALNLPCRLAAVADALLSMVDSDVLLLLLHSDPLGYDEYQFVLSSSSCLATTHGGNLQRCNARRPSEVAGLCICPPCQRE